MSLLKHIRKCEFVGQIRREVTEEAAFSLARCKGNRLHLHKSEPTHTQSLHQKVRPTSCSPIPLLPTTSLSESQGHHKGYLACPLTSAKMLHASVEDKPNCTNPSVYLFDVYRYL